MRELSEKERAIHSIKHLKILEEQYQDELQRSYEDGEVSEDDDWFDDDRR